MGHRQQFWTLETEEEVWDLARRHYPNIRTQRWVVWEWKRRKAGTYELALQPRQPRQQRRGRPTKEQQVINNFLMTTRLEDIIRMREELIPQTEETQTEELIPQTEKTNTEETNTDINCIRCQCVVDNDDLYDCSHCGSGVCFNCFTTLFTEKLNEEDDDVHIECLSCHQSTTYSNDYLD